MTEERDIETSEYTEWTAPAGEDAPAESEALVIDVTGFSGPLDLLLAMARTQKVDLAKISVLALVEQYLAYIDEARRTKLELAADYLVMAAWLAFLKSRLLLPSEDEDDGEVSAEEMAQRLAFRLKRLEAMQQAMAQLMTRNRLGQDVFERGQPEPVQTHRDTQWTAEIYDLLKAYAIQRARTIEHRHVVKARKVWSVKDARKRLQSLVGKEHGGSWVQLEMFLEHYLPDGEEARSARASSFGATLEMAREGLVQLRQDAPFEPIYMRRCEDGAEWEQIGSNFPAT